MKKFLIILIENLVHGEDYADLREKLRENSLFSEKLDLRKGRGAFAKEL